MIPAIFYGLLLAGGRTVVEPVESDALLANPGLGWQTFHRFADDDPNLAGLPSGSAYFRFYWRDLEPAEGEIDFAQLDELLAHARRAGQRLAFRVMCIGTHERAVDSPEWLREQGCPGFEFRYGDGGPLRWAPDMDSPLFQAAHFRFIRALGERYDGHPDIDLLDIGTVGLWGEWHMSGTGVAMPSEATRRAIVDAWRAAFPTTPTVMLIGDREPLRYAVEQGCGWRADCLGDFGGFSATWNHMEHFYRQQLAAAGAEEAWRTAPVAFESCWDMRKWVEEGWSLRSIFEYALELHASYLNNKSAPLPAGDEARAEVERFLRRLGYRLVLRRLEHPATVAAGRTVRFESTWDNVGVAPPYRDWRLAVRIERDQQRGYAAGESVNGWLPGEHQAGIDLAVPAEATPGRYTVAVAVVAPGTWEPAVRLAIDGRGDDGWYAVSSLEVTP